MIIPYFNENNSHLRSKDRKEEIRQSFSEKGLKVTPQRIVILEAIYRLNNHPTTENIINEVRKSNPNIASGTVYKVLDAFEKHNLITKVLTDEGIVRYDGIIEDHHHLYCPESNSIKDYFDEELDNLLRDYFRKKKINGFKIDEMTLQIKEKFENNK